LHKVTRAHVSITIEIEHVGIADEIHAGQIDPAQMSPYEELTTSPSPIATISPELARSARLGCSTRPPRVW
jgi:hypothetical protein